MTNGIFNLAHMLQGTLAASAWLGLCLWCGDAWGDSENFRVKVTDPYLEMHTGPARSYPIFHVVDRGEEVEILKQRTNWFMIRTDKGKEGWVKQSQMERTLTQTGEPMRVAEASRDDFSKRRWEYGLLGGDFNGAVIMSAYANYAFNAKLASELSISQAIGEFSTSWLAHVDLVAQPFPQWRASPYFSLGFGGLHTEPNAVLVQTQTRDHLLARVGVGVYGYLTRRFFLRGEYKNSVIFSSDEDNEEIDEWKLGFGFFF